MKRYTLNAKRFDVCALTEAIDGEYVKVIDMVDVLRTLVQKHTLDTEGVRIIIDELAVMGVGNDTQN